MATRQPPPSPKDHRLPWRTPGSWWLCIPLLILGPVLFGLSAVGLAARSAGPPTKRTDEPARPFLTQRCRGAARVLLPDGTVPGSGRQGAGRGHRQRAEAVDDQKATRPQERKVCKTQGQRLPPPGRFRRDLQFVGLGQHPGDSVAVLLP